MKKLFTLLLSFLLTFVCITNINAQEGHIHLGDGIQIDENDLNLLEQDLTNIENEYSISIYFTYDGNIGDDELSTYNENLLNKNGNSRNSVAICINNDYYLISSVGEESDRIQNNRDLIWQNVINSSDTFDFILNYYQSVVEIINSETYASNVPTIEEPKTVVDFAGLFDADEFKNLTNKLNSLASKHNMDIVVLTTNTLNSMSPQNYADDFYDYNGYKNDGILFLLSMEDRDWYVSTKGNGFSFNDYDIDYTFDLMRNDLGDGNYYEAFLTFASNVDYFLDEASKGNEYDYDREVKTFGVENIVGSAIGGGVVALIVVLILKGQLNGVRTEKFARNYVVPGSFYLTGYSDLLVSSHVSKSPRPKDTGSHSSGGSSHSSFHTSSSGSSHGGHGGKF